MTYYRIPGSGNRMIPDPGGGWTLAYNVRLKIKSTPQNKTARCLDFNFRLRLRVLPPGIPGSGNPGIQENDTPLN